MQNTIVVTVFLALAICGAVVFGTLIMRSPSTPAPAPQTAPLERIVVTESGEPPQQQDEFTQGDAIIDQRAQQIDDSQRTVRVFQDALGGQSRNQ